MIFTGPGMAGVYLDDLSRSTINGVSLWKGTSLKHVIWGIHGLPEIAGHIINFVGCWRASLSQRNFCVSLAFPDVVIMFMVEFGYWSHQQNKSILLGNWGQQGLSNLQGVVFYPMQTRSIVTTRDFHDMRCHTSLYNRCNNPKEPKDSYFTSWDFSHHNM